MRYGIEDENGDSVSLEAIGNSVFLRTGGAASGGFEFTHEEFKEFRRAVSYVWQEIEDK